ncbi:putative receptor protein kinase ZmPK1 isoform X2 [Carex rostrata]
MKNNLDLLLIATVILLPLVLSPPHLLRSSLSRGSALSVENDSDKLISPNRVFTCGFILVGTNAYTFSIWFTNSANKTKVWTTNWGHVVNGKGSLLTFQQDGDVVLTDTDGTVVWFTNTASSQANLMKLLDTGNLVVTDPKNKVMWQSFDYPTDTLLPSQPITRNIKLVSSKNNGSIYPGYYSFYFDNDNVLRMLYDGPEISSIYWPNPDFTVWQNGRTIYNSSRHGVLDVFGQFTSSDRFSLEASDKDFGIIRRLTLDSDGHLRLYSLNNSSCTWIVTWIVTITQPITYGHCDVHGLCGKNGLCLHTPSKIICSCPPNFEVSDPSDWSKGCKAKFNISCEPNSITFVQLPNSDFWGYDLNSYFNISLHHCKNHCKNDCTCVAIKYKYGTCYTKVTLFNGKSSPSVQGSIYFKVPKNARMSRVYEPKALNLICNNSEVDDIGSARLYTKKGSKIKWVYFYGFAAALGLIEILFGILGWCFVYKRGINASLAEQGYELMGSQFRKFTFKELRKATQNFKEVIGMGGSGTVYKGKLEDERAIAVKKLEDVIQGEEEFWAEVSIIGRIYHMNLVKLLGFCFDGSHRLLVSEYVENGSLDKHLFIEDASRKVLGWKERFKIALGMARGLAYLHEECLEWVIHCDVKPENILLGSDFEPKIADFGLAKLFKRGAIGSRISHIRGTRGYMAPEWASNLPITAKIDVFSYGIVLMEIVKGKRISDWTMEGEIQSYEDTRLMVCMLNERHEIQESWAGYFVDPNLGTEFDEKQAKAMVKIALSCIEEDRNRRPHMNSIVEFLLAHES